MALRTITQSPNAVQIDDSNLTVLNANKPALDIPTYWHKFIISNVYGFKRNVVLKILFEHIKPIEFIPLHYTQDGGGAFFFGRRCRAAVEKFCTGKLTIPNPYDTTKPFKMKVILKYSSTNTVKVNLTENLLMVLQKRLKLDTLCLNNFSEDPDLNEFFLLSQPNLLAFVLNVAQRLKPTGIKLCKNEIKSLDALQILAPQSITSLDLRQNGLTDLAELKYLSTFNITELWLEGNPLCELYDEYNYVQLVIKYCPKIEKLDGFLLRQNGVPSFRRNFLCNMTAYDVVDKFLEKFFPTYDSKNLHKLESFYHKHALFSMTAEYFPKQLSSTNAHLKSYKVFSRNLLNVTTYNTKNLYTGSSQIMKLFDKLPRCEHDPCSFTVDVLYYMDRRAIIVVTGVFREYPNVNRILGFNRYFVLERRDDIFRISNEQMHVFNALTSQQVTVFKNPTLLQEAKNPSEQNQMIDTFAIVSNLTKEWAKMFLEECNYNLKHAVLLFVELYKGDHIPSQSFKNFE